MEEAIKPIEYVRKFNINTLSSIFNKVQGTKGICCDSLQEKVLLATISFKEMTAIFELKGGISLYKPYAPAVEHIFYFISDNDESYKLIEKHIQAQHSNTTLKNIFVYVVANGLSPLKIKLKNLMQSFKNIEINEFPLYWICYDNTTISMYDSTVPKQLLIQQKPSALHRCAMALLQIEKLTNQKLVIRAKGEWSTKIAEIMTNNRPSIDNKKNDEILNELDIKEVIIIDRWLDPITLLLMPMTFDALVSEFFDTDISGNISVDKNEFDKPKEPVESEFQIKKFKLNDEIYSEIADSHILAIGAQIKQLSKDVSLEEAKFKDSMKVIQAWKMKMPKLEKIVKRKELCAKYLRLAEMVFDRRFSDFNHEFFNLQMEILNGSIGSDKVIPFLENSLINCECLTKCLRLISLQSLVNNGLRQQVINTYKRLILNNYGTEKLQFFVRLQICNLITEKEATLLLTKSNNYSKIHAKYPKIDFNAVKKQYTLFSESSYDETLRKDSSYAFSGYCPLLYKIIEHAINTDWSDWNTFAGGIRQQDLKALYSSNKFLFVVGGITKSEISLLKSFMPIISLIGASNVIDGNSFMETFETA
uniref:Vacuolar protein sorting-associated protein 33A n=1 Tax=Strongyloides papillosus TaxID=174720 RepID=A0A0N5BFL6_STREA